MQHRHILTLRILSALVLAIPALIAQAALPSGAVLQFVPGVYSYDSDGNPANVTSGSYFSVDVNGNGVFNNVEKTAIAMHDGIILGTSQPASGSHPGFVDGSELPGIDAAWNFFGNTGMHQTTSPVTDYGDGTLDFSGFGMTWVGIPNVSLGDPSRDTRRAQITCSSTPCQIGDTYTLNYSGHVPQGDPSGFGGVFWGLHLEGTIVNGSLLPRISISVGGGALQECSTHGGSLITLSANVFTPPNDSVAAINWTMDGNPIGNGAEIVPLIPVGAHIIAAEVRTQAGLSATATSSLTIQDTQSPTVTAAFINRRTGQVVTRVDSNTQVGIRARAVDVCDPNPGVRAMVGAPVSDGGTVSVLATRDLVGLSVPQLNLSVTATDASNNSASASASLSIGP